MAPRSTRLARFVVIATSVATATVGFAGCTLLGSREIHQCDVDEQCKGTITRPYCVDHLCSATNPNPDSGADAAEDAGSDAKADAPVQKPCTKNDQCEDEQLCIQSLCTSFVKEPCGRLPNGKYKHAYKEEGSVLVGVYVFQPNANGPDTAAAETAIQHLNEQLPGAPRIAAVLCSKPVTFSEDGGAPAVIEHLAAFNIPLAVGQFEDVELDAIAKRGKRGVAVMSTLGTLPALQEPAAGTTPNPAEPPNRFLIDELQSLAPSFEAALDEAVDRAMAMGAVAPFKVRLMYNLGEESRLLAQRLDQTMPLLAPAAGNDYAFDLIDRVPSSFISGISTSLPSGGNQIVAAAPDIVIALGGDEVVNNITLMEPAFPGLKRPVWVVGPRAKMSYNQLSKLSELMVPSIVPFRKRFIGVDFAGSSAKTVTMGTAANIAYAGSFNGLYDGLFAISLAAKRARVERGAAALVGADLVNGLDLALREAAPGRLLVDIPSNLAGGINEVGLGKDVHMVGLTGPWAFPVATTRGVRRSEGSYYCFPSTGKLLAYHVGKDALKTTCAVP